MAAEQNNEAAFRSFCRLLQDKSTAFSPRRAHETHPQLFTREQVTTFISDFGTLFSSTFPTEKYNPCAVCGVNARYQCSRCKAFNYCSLACQKQHWKTHRQECGKRTTTVIFNSFRGGDAKECVIVESAGSCSACGKLYDPGDRSFDFEFNGGILALSFCSETCLQKGRTDFSCIREFRVSFLFSLPDILFFLSFKLYFFLGQAHEADASSAF